MASVIPTNEATFSLAEIARVTGGELRGGGDTEVRGVATDSRRDLSGALFVALGGERFDGHAYVGAAVGAGAVAVLVEREPAPLPGVPMIVVPDALTALGALAAEHRRRWGGAVVAVAGSAGKTTTRRAIATLLERALPGRVHSPGGNLNNRVGVPMVLLALRREHELAVVELGTNLPGEVELLTRMSRPDVGVLTLIDLEHSEGLGAIEAIEVEEGAIFANLAPGGLALGNVDDPRVRRQLAATTAERRVGFGFGEGADYRIASRDAVSHRSAELEVSTPFGLVRLTTPLLGRAGALATTAAYAVMRAVGATLAAEEVGPALAADPGETGRLHPIELADGTLVLDDSYNANPASVRASVATARELAARRSGRLVLVLGEMRELGALSVSEHVALGRDLTRAGAALLVAIGGDACHFIRDGESDETALFVDDAETAVPHVMDRLRPGDVVLVKASRGIGAERVVAAIVAQNGRAA